MTLVELHYLVMVAQEKHFGRAAAHCHISQPTLSMAIRKLEKDLGVQLFERNKSGIRVTALGAEIIHQAQRVLQHAVTLRAIADEGADQLSGVLNIGIIPTFGPYILPQLSLQLGLVASGLRLVSEEFHGKDLHSKLRDGTLDVIIVGEPLSETDIVTWNLFTEPLVVLMSPKHTLSAYSRITPEHLQIHTVLVPAPESCLTQQVIKYFANSLPLKQPILNIGGSLETVRHMVAAGLGVAVLPASAANSTLYATDAFVIRSFVAPEPSRTITVAWRASFPRHKAIDILRRALQMCIWHFTTVHDKAGPSLLIDNSW